MEDMRLEIVEIHNEKEALKETTLQYEDDIQASAADSRQITQFQTYGTNYLLGFNYKF